MFILWNIKNYARSQTRFKIIYLSNGLTLSVPGEGYSRSASCALNKISEHFLKRHFVLLFYDFYQYDLIMPAIKCVLVGDGYVI